MAAVIFLVLLAAGLLAAGAVYSGAVSGIPGNGTRLLVFAVFSALAAWQFCQI